MAGRVAGLASWLGQLGWLAEMVGLARWLARWWLAGLVAGWAGSLARGR